MEASCRYRWWTSAVTRACFGSSGPVGGAAARAFQIARLAAVGPTSIFTSCVSARLSRGLIRSRLVDGRSAGGASRRAPSRVVSPSSSRTVTNRACRYSSRRRRPVAAEFAASPSGSAGSTNTTGSTGFFGSDRSRSIGPTRRGGFGFRSAGGCGRATALRARRKVRAQSQRTKRGAVMEASPRRESPIRPDAPRRVKRLLALHLVAQPALPQQVVVVLGEPVGFVPDELQQPERRGRAAQPDRLGLVGPEDLLLLLGQRDQGRRLDP